MNPRARLLVPILFLLIFGAVGGAVFHLSDMRGPFWIAARQSPDYAYLLSSLKLLKTGSWVPVAAHPGTPLTALGALVLKLSGDSQSVLRSPETFLRMEVGALVLCFFLSQLLLAWALWERFRSRSLIAALFFFLITSSVILERATRFAPESLLLSLVSLSLAVLIGPRIARSRGIVLGFLAALLVATKLTAAPLFLFFIFSLETSQRARFALVFFIFSLLLWIPSINDIASLRTLFGGLSRSNYSIRQFITDCVREVPGMVFVIVIALSAAIRRPFAKKHLGVLSSVAATGLLLSFSPGLNYALPLFSVAGLMLALSLDRAKMAVSFLFIGALIQIPSSFAWIRETQSQRVIQEETALIMDSEDGETMTCNYGSSIAFSLHKANFQTGNSFSTELSKQYPNTLFCDLTSEIAGNWNQSWKLHEILRLSSGLIVLGPPNEEERLALLTEGTVNVERKTRYESIYRLRKIAR